MLQRARNFLAWNAYTNNSTTLGPQMLHNRFTNVTAGHSIGRLFGILLLILIGASLLPSVANATTGITIAHTGFTPNVNVTSTPGFVPLIQILPLVFIGVLLGYAVDELTAVL